MMATVDVDAVQLACIVALIGLCAGGVKWAARKAAEKLLGRVDRVLHAVEVELPKRLDDADTWRSAVDEKLNTIDGRLCAGDSRMGAIETSITEHTAAEEQLVAGVIEAIREGKPVGRAAE